MELAAREDVSWNFLSDYVRKISQSGVWMSLV